MNAAPNNRGAVAEFVNDERLCLNTLADELYDLQAMLALACAGGEECEGWQTMRLFRMAACRVEGLADQAATVLDSVYVPKQEGGAA